MARVRRGRGARGRPRAAEVGPGGRARGSGALWRRGRGARRDPDADPRDVQRCGRLGLHRRELPAALFPSRVCRRSVRDRPRAERARDAGHRDPGRLARSTRRPARRGGPRPRVARAVAGRDLGPGGEAGSCRARPHGRGGAGARAAAVGIRGGAPRARDDDEADGDRAGDRAPGVDRLARSQDAPPLRRRRCGRGRGRGDRARAVRVQRCVAARRRMERAAVDRRVSAPARGHRRRGPRRAARRCARVARLRRADRGVRGRWPRDRRARRPRGRDDQLLAGSRRARDRSRSPPRRRCSRARRSIRSSRS